jgi:hypothetical protein
MEKIPKYLVIFGSGHPWNVYSYIINIREVSITFFIQGFYMYDRLYFFLIIFFF